MNSLSVIEKDLKKLGLQQGDVVITHSSLKSMGQVEGGADTLIDALIQVVGSEGTVLFPALSFFPCCSTRKFDQNLTPCCVGTIPEVFRKRQGVLRSFHPTHSVCAFGKKAEEITKYHYLDDTPVGKNSPYQKLIECGGKILMLGCGLRPNTFMHGVEEIGNAPYCLGDAMTFEMTDKDGNVTYKDIKQHYFHREGGNIDQRYDRVVDVLTLNQDYVVGNVHGATAYLIDAKKLSQKAVQKMQQDPCYFVDDLNNVLKLK